MDIPGPCPRCLNRSGGVAIPSAPFSGYGARPVGRDLALRWKGSAAPETTMAAESPGGDRAAGFKQSGPPTGTASRLTMTQTRSGPPRLIVDFGHRFRKARPLDGIDPSVASESL